MAGLLAGGLLLTTATSAWAQPYPLCDRTPSDDDVEAAKGMHKAAENYYAKARYDRAISSWMDAYNFDCTAHRLLVNVGNAYEKLGQTNKAIEAFETYVDRTGPAADQVIIDKVANLKELLRKQQLANQPKPAPDPDPELGIGDPNPPEDPSDPGTEGDVNVLPWVVVGAGGVMVVVGAVLLGVGAGDISAAEEICDGRACNKEIAAENAAIDQGNNGITLQGVGTGVLITGVLAAAGGVIWHLVDSPGDGAAEDGGAEDGLEGEEAAEAWHVRPEVFVSPGYAGFGLTGSF